MDTEQFWYSSERKSAVLGLLGGVIFFQCIGILMSKIGAPSSIGKSKNWKYKNIFVSFIHSTIIGIWCIIVNATYSGISEDLVGFNNLPCFMMVCLSTGYFIYDFIDTVWNEPISRHWEVLLHHIAIGSIFSYNLIQYKCIGLSSLVLLGEVTAIFLHGRKLLQLRQVDPNSWLYRLTVWLNLISAFLLRIVFLIFLFVRIYSMKGQISDFYFTFLMSAIVTMTPLQVGLFIRLIQTDIIRKRGPLREQTRDRRNETSENLNNNKENGAVLLNDKNANKTE